jgi:magnesium-transporting ATPase (P-type)
LTSLLPKRLRPVRAKPESRDGAAAPAWHSLPAGDVLETLSVTLEGLGPASVAERQEAHGPNALPEPQPPTIGQIILHQFQSPLIYILLIAGVVSLLVGDTKDALFIFGVVALNAALGSFQEWRAERSAAALQSLLRIAARVRRSGAEQEIDARELVPGDIVLLEGGNRIPADLRLLRTRNFSVDESFLTGESAAVNKDANATVAAEVSIGDRTNVAYAGSTVMTGRATGVAVAIGLETEIGHIARATTLTEATKPPLLIRMDRFVHVISIVVLVAMTVLAVILLAQGTPLMYVFFFAVALAVSAIPEGLPVALTVALSVAVSRMARRRVIVRKMTAVEGLGSCTLIASDKTGTLTVNQQTVRVIAAPTGERFRVSGEGYAGKGEVTTADGGMPDKQTHDWLRSLARAMVLCNEATLAHDDGRWRHSGDAMDVALLALAYKLGQEPHAIRESVTEVAEIPFESERKYAARVFQEDGQGPVLVAVKGAAETVLDMCHGVLAPAGPSRLDRGVVEAKANRLAEEGFRVIVVARGELPIGAETADFAEDHLPPLELLGLVGMQDPLRPDAKEAVETCRQAGVRVAMITGDHPATALTIARELGIAERQADLIVGVDLPAVESGEEPGFVERVKDASVFARVTPLQKLHLVQAFRRLGDFVAVTGDGVNDAPALRVANIGVAMGSGTDLAKDTASIIVVDNSFASIVEGIRQGRYAYDNVRKVIYLLISTGAAEIAMFLLAIVLRLPIPLLPVQILWLNLVTNGIQDVALAFEGGEPGAMRRPPRKPAEGIFNRLMVQQTVLSGATMAAGAFALWYWLLRAGHDEFMSRNLVLLLMVLFQNFHVGNCRSEYVSVFRLPLRRNPVLLVGVAAALGLHLLMMHTPFMQEILAVAPVTFWDAVPLIVIAASVLLVMEVFKWLRGGRRDRRGANEKRD